MAIGKAQIAAIKTGVDLKALVESRGIDLKKNGKGYFGLCPFHDDKNPSLSINPDQNLFQCFGCGAAGDVIRFVELFDKVTFPEAVKRLSGNGAAIPKRRSSKAKKTTSQASLTVKEKKLLARVMTRRLCQKATFSMTAGAA
jgi:DNA primase